MKLYFTIFPKRVLDEPYFLRESNIIYNRFSNKDVKSLFRFERSFTTIAQSIGLEKVEQDRVRKIEQRLPDHKLIGVARWEITIPKKMQSALCYLFVCENGDAYLSAPDMTFSGDTNHIEKTTRQSVYKTSYKLTTPDKKYGYVNLRFDCEFSLVTKRRGVSKNNSTVKIVSEMDSLLAENQKLRQEIEEMKGELEKMSISN